MTQEQIKEQIAVINKVGTEVRKTKESARQFLMEAGIIKKDTPKQIFTASTHK